MGPPVLSASLLSGDSLTLLSLALVFFSLLSVSLIPCCPLSSLFNIIAILPLFYCCSSLNLHKLGHNNMTSSTKGPKRIGSSKAGSLFSCEENSINQGQKFRRIKNSDPPHDDILLNTSQSSDSHVDASIYSEPPTSPFNNSPWSSHMNESASAFDPGVFAPNVLMGSLVREEGHIYSLAASGDLLYTGSDSKNIRVWKHQKEFSGFKSNSGLVKAIVISGDRIFTGHQDGKIRLWKVSSKNPSVHKRVGTLPTMMDYLKSSVKPSSYVEVRRKKNSIWLKHLDAISCLSLSEDGTFLYSASWDKTFKVWRVSDSKCLESITAHDDAVNSLVAGFDGLVFTGSADGSVKVWRRELQGKGTKHFFSQTLIKQECAVTALAVNPEATVVYCGSSDGLVNFWEREQQLTHGGVLKGHKLAVLCLVTAGSLLFSGSADTAICVWRKMGNNHICLSSLTGHSGPVKCLAAEKDFESASNDRRWILYSGSLDKSVKMWRISEQAPPMSWNNNGNEAAPMPTSLPTAPSFASIN